MREPLSSAAEIDELFDKILTPDNNCLLEDINPSQPGWEIIIHFKTVSPDISANTSQDYAYFKTLSLISSAKVEEINDPIRDNDEPIYRAIKLSYDEDNGFDDSFDEETLEKLKKYILTCSATGLSNKKISGSAVCRKVSKLDSTGPESSKFELDLDDSFSPNEIPTAKVDIPDAPFRTSEEVTKKVHHTIPEIQDPQKGTRTGAETIKPTPKTQKTYLGLQGQRAVMKKPEIKETPKKIGLNFETAVFSVNPKEKEAEIYCKLLEEIAASMNLSYVIDKSQSPWDIVLSTKPGVDYSKTEIPDKYDALMLILKGSEI